MKVFEEYLKQNHAKLTCYVQTPNDELPRLRQRPGVLILPGGGYTVCSAREAEPVALAYLHAGYQAFVLEYSTGDRHSREGMAAVFPKAFADGVEAMEYLRGHAEALSLLSDKAAAVGFSAGPNLLETVTSETSPMFMFNSQGDTVTPATNTLRLSLTLGEAADEARFRSAAEGAKRAYQALFLRSCPDTDRQAKLVRPLTLGLADGEMAEKLEARLAQAVQNREYRIGTGFLSTPFVLDVLTTVANHAEEMAQKLSAVLPYPLKYKTNY